MKRDEIQHLLGGYAAGTLTPEEQRILCAAAIDDQELFNALADEQALKELLDDPDARGYLRAALAEAPAAGAAPRPQKTWWITAAGVAALAASLAFITVISIQKSTPPATEMARNVPAPAAPPVEADARPAAKGESQPPAAPPKPVEADARPAAKGESQPSAAPPTPVEADARPAARRESQPSAAPPKPVEAQPRTSAPRESQPSDGRARRVAPSPRSPSGPEEKAAEPVILHEAPRASPPTQAPRQDKSAADAAAAPRQLSASQLFLTQYRQNFASESARAAGGSLGAARDSGDARQRAAPPEEANRGIRYQILRKNSRDQYVQTRLDTRFEAGDDIVLLVDKNVQGDVAILAGDALVPIATQTATQAQSAPIRLAAGPLDLTIALAAGAPARSQLRPSPGQLIEQSGNLMYVVQPGAQDSPVVARFKITVH